MSTAIVNFITLSFLTASGGTHGAVCLLGFQRQINLELAPSFERGCRVALAGTLRCREQRMSAQGRLERVPDSATRYPLCTPLCEQRCWHSQLGYAVVYTSVSENRTKYQ